MWFHGLHSDPESPPRPLLRAIEIAYGGEYLGEVQAPKLDAIHMGRLRHRGGEDAVPLRARADPPRETAHHDVRARGVFHVRFPDHARVFSEPAVVRVFDGVLLRLGFEAPRDLTRRDVVFQAVQELGVEGRAGEL